MTMLRFRITFFTAFRVGASHARDGIDAPIDHLRPLPADHLKGMMRSAAEDTLALSGPVVRRVFGSTATPCGWAWSDAEPVDDQHPWLVTHRHRVHIDLASHSAAAGSLVLGETAWTDRSQFHLTRIGPDDRHRAEDQLVLAAAAAAVHAIGAWRRRGLGWVAITTPDVTLDVAAADHLLSLRRPAPPLAPVQVTG